MNDTWLRDNVKDLLQAVSATVVFTKKDGTERSMNCTLQESFLPKVEVDSTAEKKTRSENLECLSVWDIDNEGWRSFRLDSIKEIILK
jgi:hypothetical protein